MQSRRTGSFGGLSLPKQTPSPVKLKYMKHYKLVEFLSNFNVKTPART